MLLSNNFRGLDHVTMERPLWPTPLVIEICAYLLRVCRDSQLGNRDRSSGSVKLWSEHRSCGNGQPDRALCLAARFADVADFPGCATASCSAYNAGLVSCAALRFFLAVPFFSLILEPDRHEYFTNISG